MTEKLAAEIVKKSGIMRDTGMTSATPKPRVGAVSIAAWIIIGLAFARGCGAAEATLQSARPWTLGQCDRLAARRASAVFNRSIYSSGGWPLWQVVCVYRLQSGSMQRGGSTTSGKGGAKP